MDMPTISRVAKPRTRKQDPPMQRQFRPIHHGTPLTIREFDNAKYTPGYKYEIIAGRLYVSPQPNRPENWLENWLLYCLMMYARANPKTVSYVTNKARVIVPNVDDITIPEPDLAIYAADQCWAGPASEWDWAQVSPFIVCEVLVDGDINKDLTRNPELYLQVPSIREYWILNGAENADEPSLIQYVRRGKRWIITTHAFGATFTTKLLPGFTLTIDPRT